MKCNFISDFVPTPNVIFDDVLEPNTGFKVQIYNGYENIANYRSEFERLYSEGYTHVVNMPGNINCIYKFAKYFRLICRDHRLDICIANICSDMLLDELNLERN